MKKKPDWDSIVAAFEGSGLTQAAFCERKGFGLASFKKHLYRVRAGQMPVPMFSELSIKAVARPSCPMVELHFADGIFLRFPGGICAVELRGYIAELRP